MIDSIVKVAGVVFLGSFVVAFLMWIGDCVTAGLGARNTYRELEYRVHKLEQMVDGEDDEECTSAR